MVVLQNHQISTSSSSPSIPHTSASESESDTTSTNVVETGEVKRKRSPQHYHINPFHRKKVVRGNIFMTRSSRLDLHTLVFEDNPMRGFFTLFWMAMAFYTIVTLYQTWKKEGTPFKLHFVMFISKDGLGLAFADLCMVLSCAMSVIIAKLFIAGWIPRAAILGVQHTWQLSWFCACVYTVFHRDWPWVQSGFFVMHSIAMLMKQHSYIATNREYLLKSDLLKSLEEKLFHLTSKSKKDDTETKDDDTEMKESEVVDKKEEEVEGLSDEITHLRSDLYRPTNSFPNNVTFYNFADYMVLPTLVYDLEYPRTNIFRPGYFVEKVCATLGTFSLLILTVEYSILPVLQNMPKLGMSDALVQLLMPFMVCYLLVFYIIFECICNGFAELTGFGDRDFYDDWWNSSSFDEFARKWNKPVHEFLLRHVYLESMHNLKMSKKDATLFTFILSSLLHELVFAVIGKRVRLYLFLLQMFQLPLIEFARLPMIKKRKTLGNCIFWFGMFLGPPLLGVIYCREHYK